MTDIFIMCCVVYFVIKNNWFIFHYFTIHPLFKQEVVTYYMHLL